MPDILNDIKKILIDNNVISEVEAEENFESSVTQVANEIDSFLYLSIIASIEEQYEIELPSAFLSANALENIRDFAAKVDSIIRMKDENGC